VSNVECLTKSCGLLIACMLSANVLARGSRVHLQFAKTPQAVRAMLWKLSAPTWPRGEWPAGASGVCGLGSSTTCSIPLCFRELLVEAN
jgi:hypothetical protein